MRTPRYVIKTYKTWRSLEVEREMNSAWMSKGWAVVSHTLEVAEGISLWTVTYDTGKGVANGDHTA